MKKQAKRKAFTLDIYGQEYDVVYVNNLQHPLGNGEVCGVCDDEASLISINNGMSDQMTACTVFHEMFHAYARRMGMENSGMSYELEEILADQFGKLLAENFSFDF